MTRPTTTTSDISPYPIITEPRGSVRPNVRDKEVTGLKWDILVDRTVGLPCPVQGFPAPTFRYGHVYERKRGASSSLQAVAILLGYSAFFLHRFLASFRVVGDENREPRAELVAFSCRLQSRQVTSRRV